jgi:hypothetical protein
LLSASVCQVREEGKGWGETQPPDIFICSAISNRAQFLNKISGQQSSHTRRAHAFRFCDSCILWATGGANEPRFELPAQCRYQAAINEQCQVKYRSATGMSLHASKIGSKLACRPTRAPNSKQSHRKQDPWHQIATDCNAINHLPPE